MKKNLIGALAFSAVYIHAPTALACGYAGNWTAKDNAKDVGQVLKDADAIILGKVLRGNDWHNERNPDALVEVIERYKGDTPQFVTVSAPNTCFRDFVADEKPTVIVLYKGNKEGVYSAKDPRGGELFYKVLLTRISSKAGEIKR